MSPRCRHPKSCKHLVLLTSLIWHGLCSLPSSCEQFPVFASARRGATSPASRRPFLWVIGGETGVCPRAIAARHPVSHSGHADVPQRSGRPYEDAAPRTNERNCVHG